MAVERAELLDVGYVARGGAVLAVLHELARGVLHEVAAGAEHEVVAELAALDVAHVCSDYRLRGSLGAPVLLACDGSRRKRETLSSYRSSASMSRSRASLSRAS